MLFVYGQINSDELIKEKAINLLEALGSEKNTIITKWAKIEIKAQNALESQSLIELYNNYCSEKKCLDCTFGNKILNRLSD